MKIVTRLIQCIRSWFCRHEFETMEGKMVAWAMDRNDFDAGKIKACSNRGAHRPLYTDGLCRECHYAAKGNK